jgi:flagellar hook assembly protein FlgD
VGSRFRLSIAVAALAASIVMPAPVAAVSATTVFTATKLTIEANEQACFTVTTTNSTGGWVNGGAVNAYETTSGSDVYIGGYAYQGGWPSTGGFCTTPILAVGAHTYRAEYYDGSTYQPATSTAEVTVEKATPDWTIWTMPATPEAGSPVEITAFFYDNDINEQGTLSVYRNGIATPICTAGPTNNDAIVCTVTAWAAGTYQLTAKNSGSATVAASTSPPHTLTVIANTVHASGVGTQYTTFYPVTDTYRDTVGIKGTRGETASVTIKIYSPGGTLLKTASIASGSGAYNYNWNGRNSSGTIYAEGSYKIVQTIKDSLGATKTYTNYVSLSKKKLYTYTKTITKLGSSVAAKGTASGGTVSLSTTYGYAKLYAPTIYTSWAGVGYELTIPSATIYKWMYVRIYGRHSGVGGETELGAQNFSTCAYSTTATWYDSCFASWVSIPGTTGTTKYYYRTPGLTSSYRSGTKVRLLVSSSGGTTYIYKAEVRIQYQVLKY